MEVSEGTPGNADAPGDTEGTPVPDAMDANGDPRRDRKGLRSVLRSNWLIGVATGLISGILVAFYVSATGQSALTAIRHHLIKPSCSDPQWLLQVPDSQVFTSAYYMQSDQIGATAAFTSPPIR
jgi:hypothetical protein